MHHWDGLLSSPQVSWMLREWAYMTAQIHSTHKVAALQTQEVVFIVVAKCECQCVMCGYDMPCLTLESPDG